MLFNWSTFWTTQNQAPFPGKQDTLPWFKFVKPSQIPVGSAPGWNGSACQYDLIVPWWFHHPQLRWLMFCTSQSLRRSPPNHGYKTGKISTTTCSCYTPRIPCLPPPWYRGQHFRNMGLPAYWCIGCNHQKYCHQLRTDWALKEIRVGIGSGVKKNQEVMCYQSNQCLWFQNLCCQKPGIYSLWILETHHLRDGIQNIWLCFQSKPL